VTARLLLLALILSATRPLLAQLTAERLTPPVVSAGSRTTLETAGKFPQWPVQAIVDRPDVTIEAGEKTGRWQVAVPEDAAPGIAWIRFTDDRSASDLLPLLITRATVAVESEPNDRLATAMPLELPLVVHGRLAKRGDLDGFRVHVPAGKTLVVSATANRRLASPMDAVLQLADLQGNVLAQSDDARGIDPQLVYTPHEDRELIVRIFAFPETPNSTIGFSGADSFGYALTLTSGPFFDLGLPFIQTAAPLTESRFFGWNLPAEPHPARQPGHPPAPSPIVHLAGALGWQPQPRSAPAATVRFAGDANIAPTETDRLPVLFAGRLQQPHQVDRLRFPVEEGKRYHAEVHARRFGVLLDSTLQIVDPSSGKTIADNDDRSRRQYDAAVSFAAPADGSLELQVRELSGLGGPRRAYTVELREAVPTVELTVAGQRFVASPQDPATLEIAINRLDGYARPLQVTAVGLPDGLSAAAVESAAKGDSAKAVELQLINEGAAPFQGSFTIIATEQTEAGEATETTYRATFPLRDGWDLRQFWLTVPPPETS